MSKLTLRIVSIIMVFFGVATMMPTWTWSAGAEWYAVVQIIVGIIGFAVAYSDKR
jgi:hypothetical protein